MMLFRRTCVSEKPNGTGHTARPPCRALRTGPFGSHADASRSRFLSEASTASVQVPQHFPGLTVHCLDAGDNHVYGKLSGRHGGEMTDLECGTHDPGA